MEVILLEVAHRRRRARTNELPGPCCEDRTCRVSGLVQRRAQRPEGEQRERPGPLQREVRRPRDFADSHRPRLLYYLVRP